MTVRGWNILVLAALSRSSGASAALLFEHFSTFSLAYNLSLNQYQSVHMLDNADAQDRAHADISYAYASIKLWLLLARKASQEHSGVDATGALQDAEGIAAKMVWNELWPPFETVITAFEVDARGGNVSVRAAMNLNSMTHDTQLSCSLLRRACGRRLPTCSCLSVSRAPSSLWTLPSQRVYWIVSRTLFGENPRFVIPHIDPSSSKQM